MDARAALKRFANWCIQRSGWYAASELSWTVTTFIGNSEIAWSKPLFESYIAGAWFLHWTDDVLYWIAKPSLSIETPGSRRRLSNETGPAVKSDCEDIFFINGVMLDEQIVMRPETQTVEQIRGETNEEVKRLRIERFGWHRYLPGINAKPIHSRRNDIEGTRESLFRAENSNVLVCACPSTSKVFGLEVPLEIETCEQSQAYLSGGLSSRIISAS